MAWRDVVVVVALFLRFLFWIVRTKGRNHNVHKGAVNDYTKESPFPPWTSAHPNIRDLALVLYNGRNPSGITTKIKRKQGEHTETRKGLGDPNDRAILHHAAV